MPQALAKARFKVRSSGFDVPKTSNFGPRTLVRLTFPASLARYPAKVIETIK